MTRLISRTVSMEHLPDLIDLMPGTGGFLWIREGQGFAGWGEALRILPSPGPDRFATAWRDLEAIYADADIEDDVRLPGSGPIAFGSWGFTSSANERPLVIPAMTIGIADDRAWMTINSVASASTEATQAMPAPLPMSSSIADEVSRERAWLRAVERARDAIRAGELEKVVLAMEVALRSRTPFDIRVVARALAARFPQCYTFAIDGLVGASPELLARRTGSSVESVVLAGSAPRSDDGGEDAAYGAALLDSQKDRWEHDLAVRGARSSLAAVCAELKMDAEPSLLRLANVQHLMTTLRGELSSPLSALELAGVMHPTAAVCGVPTDVALRTIAELEDFDRGRYAGPVGWVDARGDGEWAIALRCAEIAGDTARLFAGAGIVADSDPADELAETKLKLEAMRSVLENGKP